MGCEEGLLGISKFATRVDVINGPSFISLPPLVQVQAAHRVLCDRNSSDLSKYLPMS